MDRGFAVTARNIVEPAIGEHLDGNRPEDPDNGKNPHAVALGRMGGQKGGKARAMKLSKEQRRTIAALAANKRWHGK